MTAVSPERAAGPAADRRALRSRAAWRASHRAPPAVGRGGVGERLRALKRLVMTRLCNPAAGAALWCCGLRERGRRNAHDVRLAEHVLAVEDLPHALDGFRILQVGDLHVDAAPGAAERAVALAAGLRVDLCVLTGDYLPHYSADHARALDCLARLRDGVESRLGFAAILGNYDPPSLVDGIETLGLHVLIDETLTLDNAGSPVSLTGTDDPYAQDDRCGRAALAARGPGLGIALVHTPDLAASAAAAGFHVYLCGHTHGGQMCLPGGRALLTNTRARPDLARGLWREGGMVGYTTTGVGISGLALRYNCPPEIALLTLRRVEVHG